MSDTEEETCDINLHFIDCSSGRVSRPWRGTSAADFKRDREIETYFDIPKSVMMVRLFHIVVPTSKGTNYVTRTISNVRFGDNPLCVVANYALALAAEHKPREAPYALAFFMHSYISPLPPSAERRINKWRSKFEKPSASTSASAPKLKLSDAASLVRAKYDQYKIALSTAKEPAVSMGDFVHFALPLKDHAIFVSGPEHQAAFESLGFKFTPLSYPNCRFPEPEAYCTLVTPSGTHGTMCIVDASGV